MLAQAWAQLGGRPAALDAVRFEGPAQVLPSVYDVTACAGASVAAATLALAQWQAMRSGRALAQVRVDLRHASAAFRCERYLAPVGWQLPPVWDPLAGDYATRDGWIRLHTNYSYHRDAVLRVLDVACEREAVRDAVARADGEALEAAVVAEGGCAALMRSPAQWAAHPAGRAVASEALIAWQYGAALARTGSTLATNTTPRPLAQSVAESATACGSLPLAGRAAWSSFEPGALPLAGVRVLDLTRVIAGPLATRTLAAFGADVLRIDPPGFEEVGALLPDMTAGKRRAALDLRGETDRVHFEALVAGADVLVHGLRGGALAALGWDTERLRALNPALIVVTHDAYGYAGPFRQRRGFDSLVQMSCGIAARGMELAGRDRPHPLPAQALDHATGYLLAAATCMALERLGASGVPSEARLSLAKTAHWLMAAGERGDVAGRDFSASDAEPWLEDAQSAFGPLRRVRYPGRIEGVTPAFVHRPGPLGTDCARW